MKKINKARKIKKETQRSRSLGERLEEAQRRLLSERSEETSENKQCERGRDRRARCRARRRYRSAT